MYHESGRDDLSLPFLRKAAQLGPDAFRAAFYLGNVERRLGLLADAQIHLKKAAALDPDSAEAHAELGALLIDLDDIDAATNEFRRAVSLKPDSTELNTRMALLHAIAGRPDDAAKFYAAAISSNPFSGDAHYGLAYLRRFRSYDDDLERMEEAYRSAQISDPDRILVGFALGKAFDDLSLHDKAFEYMHQANELQRQSIVYSFCDQKKMFDRHKKAFDQDFVDHCRAFSVADDTAIFILGMPRSGTSLVEQILASHPLVHGAGEVEYSRLFADDVRRLTGRAFPQSIASIAAQKLHDLALGYIKRLRFNAGAARHVIDKLPHNFLRIGLFAALMPNAKIVLCERDPLDTCLSIYQHPMAPDHGYASDMTELGKYYRLYQDMMSYWDRLLPGHMIRIRYEELVEDPDGQVRELLDNCGLPFDPACLSFYETRRIVDTPSALQVRKPIYKSAVGRAKKYHRSLRPLAAALASH